MSEGAVRRLLPVFGDQLSPRLASLRDADPARDVLLLAEVMSEASYVPHHPRKIALIFSAMRHFASEMRARLPGSLSHPGRPRQPGLAAGRDRVLGKGDGRA